jgi:hypothetical protein
MVSGAIGAKVKFAFFDSKAVTRRVDPKKKRFLSKFGAFTRRTARSSIKSGGKKNKTSAPGEPPRAHGKSLLKKGIFFGYDFRNESVVIGPVLRATDGGRDAATAIEEGGNISFTVKGHDGKPVRKTATIAARPFMGPAFRENEAQISSIWKKANPGS